MNVCPFTSYRKEVMDNGWGVYYKKDEFIWKKVEVYEEFRKLVHKIYTDKNFEECRSLWESLNHQSFSQRKEEFLKFWIWKSRNITDNGSCSIAWETSENLFGVTNVDEWLIQWIYQFSEVTLKWLDILYTLYPQGIPLDKINDIKKANTFTSMIHLNWLLDFSPLNLDLRDSNGNMSLKSRTLTTKEYGWPRIGCPARSILSGLTDCFILFLYKEDALNRLHPYR